jgi:hypothetical protein
MLEFSQIHAVILRNMSVLQYSLHIYNMNLQQANGNVSLDPRGDVNVHIKVQLDVHL